MRLDKFLAQSGAGKRDHVRAGIKNGLASVNGVKSVDPVMDINEKDDRIIYDGREIVYKDKHYIMFNKPSGCVTARRDHKDKTVFHYLENTDTRGLFHVGRLDKNTEGLLIFTNDGDFEHSLMNPEKHVRKTYFFITLGDIDSEKKEKLQSGVYMTGHEGLTRPAKVEILLRGKRRDMIAHFKLNDFYDKVSERYNPDMTAGTLTITEGKKHQVKRMIKAVGGFVIYLRRDAIGNLKLDDSLGLGEYREMTSEEVNSFEIYSKEDN